MVTDPDEHRGRRVLIIGGGDTAFDWATQLVGRARHVTVAHRSDRFRAHSATLAEFRRAVGAGKASLLTFHELNDIFSRSGDDGLTHVVLRDNRTQATKEVRVDVVLPLLGFVSDLGPVGEWGLTLDGDEIVVDSQMSTGRAVYAAGDVTTYPGKLKLIVSGFSEAAIAVNEAVHWVDPQKRVSPGHSSNLAVFGQTDG